MQLPAQVALVGAHVGRLQIVSFFNSHATTQLTMDVHEVRRAGEQVRAAEAVFATLKALHEGCEQELRISRSRLFEWRCANRRSRVSDQKNEELQRDVSKAKELQEQAWQDFQSAWEDLRLAKQAYLAAIMAYNSARRCGSMPGECVACLDVLISNA